jgi:hypothetical protein
MGSGARSRNRTSDTAIFSRMLYQLSYPGDGPGDTGTLLILSSPPPLLFSRVTVRGPAGRARRPLWPPVHAMA